jgi:hypothetical protein
MLFDTIISIVDDKGTAVITPSNGMTMIKFSYTAMSLAPDLKSLFAESEMLKWYATFRNLLHMTTCWVKFHGIDRLPDQLMQPIVMPVKLLVPADYPRSSPVLVCDQGNEELW